MTVISKTKSGLEIMFAGLVIPITFLNVFGVIISGIWLVIIGEWGEIFRGILFMVVSGFIISIALAPSLLLAVPLQKSIEKERKIIAVLLGSLSVLYTFSLMTIWCLWILWLFTSNADGSSFIPLMIWSYGVAMAPWTWLARKEIESGGGGYEQFTIFFAQTAYIISMVVLGFGGDFATIKPIFVLIMLIGLLMEIYLVLGAKLKEIIAPKEVKEALSVLNEIGKKFNGGGFALIKEHLEPAILSQKDDLIRSVKSGRTVQKYVHSMVANVSGDKLETGLHHIYRGVLDNSGQELLQIYDASLEELVKLGDMDDKAMKKEKDVMRKHIEDIG